MEPNERMRTMLSLMGVESAAPEAATAPVQPTHTYFPQPVQVT